MKFIKRILGFLVEPVKLSGNREFSEAMTKFFTKRKYIIYIAALLATSVIIALLYL